MSSFLRPGENVIHPAPYEPGVYAPVLITTERIMQYGDAGRKDVELRQVAHVGRGVDDRIVKVIALLLLVGLPFFVIGAYKYLSVRGEPDGPPAVEKKDDPEAEPAPKPTRKELARFQEVKSTRTTGIALGVFGALALGAAYLLSKRRHTVIAGGAGRAVTIRTKSKQEQTQIMMTLQAVVQAAKAMPPPAASAPPRR